MIRLKNTLNDNIGPKMFQKLSQDYGCDVNFINILKNMLDFDEDQRWDFVRIEK